MSLATSHLRNEIEVILKFKIHLVLCQRILDGGYAGFICVLANKWGSNLHRNITVRYNLLCFHISIIAQHIFLKTSLIQI